MIMITTIARSRERSGRPTARAEAGFTLVELVIAMSIFLIISGAAFSLFNQQQKSSALLQGQTALNVGLRSAVSQLQMDVVGGGSGYFQAANMPSWPVGLTIVNNMNTAGTACNTGQTYGVACFDQLTIVAAAPYPANCVPGSCYPPINITGPTPNVSPCPSGCSCTNQGVAYGQAAVVNGTAWTLANTAAEFVQGDQLLFMNSTGKLISAAVLTAGAASSNGMVKFTFNATNSDGSNKLSNDPLDITACDGTYGTGLGCNNTSNSGIYQSFTNQFCPTSYVVKLAPIIYLVCAGPGSNATWCDQTSNSPDILDPKLVRIQNGNKNVVMEQVIGFRVGAAIWNGSYEQSDLDSASTSYNYLASTYCIGGNVTGTTCPNGISVPWNFSMVRSIRISLIGRTVPTKTDNEFQNTFDQGHYQVQGIAIVINPRNLSMNDN
ncbi:MAG: prepilin-type N-terminal cleavage/methylation domain-containing protein [Candidatus Korobacteraceae bacterium]